MLIININVFYFDNIMLMNQIGFNEVSAIVVLQVETSIVFLSHLDLYIHVKNMYSVLEHIIVNAQ